MNTPAALPAVHKPRPFASACLCAALLLLAFRAPLPAQAGRIYTQPDAAATGAIAGRATGELTHAIAVERDRVRVYRGALSDGGRAFRFERLPVGKYDLVLFASSGAVWEGIALGEPAILTGVPARNLEQRAAAADGFFNHSRIHRTGISADGEMLLAFVERYRANNVLKQSGEALGQMVRRFEIMELARAADDWQVTSSRHLYREGEPVPAAPQFRQTVFLPALGGIRIVNILKDVGEISLPSNTSTR